MKTFIAQWTQYFNTHKGRVSLFAEVYNLFNALNIRGYEENVFVNAGRRTTGINRNEFTQLPRLPTVGVTWEF